MAQSRIYPGTTSAEITEREFQHMRLVRRAAAEGMVLLKNDGCLPLKKGSRVALYGFGARYTIKGGTGSGAVNNRSNVSVDEGLRNNGFVVTTDGWLDEYDKRYKEARFEWERGIMERVGTPVVFDKLYYEHSSHPMTAPMGAPLGKSEGADGEPAIYVISRVSGEGADRKAEKDDYYLSDEEYATLKSITDHYRKTIVVLNVGGIIDLSFLDELPVSAVILMSQAGMEGGNALADVLCGDVCPQGRLTDTWAYHYEDYPGSADFSHNNGNLYEEKYAEGIFVGYKYFDTFDVPCRYPLGYGLTYTTFSLEWGKVAQCSDDELEIPVKITNTGNMEGREIVQLYVSCPVNRYYKEKRRLIGYTKTGLLLPGESELCRIRFALPLLESWHTGRASYYMEEGDYFLFGGTDIGSLTMCGRLYLSEMRWIQKLANICPLADSLKELRPDQERAAEWRKAFAEQADSAGIGRFSIDEMVRERATPDYDGAAADPETDGCRNLAGSDPEREDTAGKASGQADTRVRSILEKMTLEEKAALCCGRPKNGESEFIGGAAVTVPGAAGETTNILEEKYGVPHLVMADGPAGVRISQKYQLNDAGDPVEYDSVRRLLNRCFGHEFLEEGREIHYQFATAIPIGTLLAQTYDTGLLEAVGALIRRELKEFGIRLWLAPGMNIHRNPLCGRNFEYYSEDPLISGITAAAITKGVQAGGYFGTTIKHFACNNQEENRMGVSSIVSERALREIYLKGFEIAVKTAQPAAIMTSYNKINGIHAANSHDLCTKAARKEWGFRGIIMTDWTTTNGHGSSAAKCVRAGNDLTMPGTIGDIREIIDAVKAENDQSLEERYLDECAGRMLALLLEKPEAES